jgi:hypothetical protein
MKGRHPVLRTERLLLKCLSNPELSADSGQIRSRCEDGLFFFFFFWFFETGFLCVALAVQELTL